MAFLFGRIPVWLRDANDSTLPQQRTQFPPWNLFQSPSKIVRMGGNGSVTDAQPQARAGLTGPPLRRSLGPHCAPPPLPSVYGGPAELCRGVQS